MILKSRACAPGRCPNCGVHRDMFTCLTGDKFPTCGDPIICDKCCVIHTIDQDGVSLRGFTIEEAAELEAAMVLFPQMREQIMRAVGAVRLFRFGEN